ncbi:MAG TPA: hypothetical protein PKC18_19420, partial [Lacipirellulaceae bacterium]|nr:hypothetical protein [Lacipirellulaceae bacterium]
FTNLGSGPASPVTVENAGSAWNITGNLAVGNLGASTLAIKDQATVHLGGQLDVWQGIVNLEGGTLRFDGYFRAPYGTINYSSGVVQLAGNRNIGTDMAISDFLTAVPSLPTGKGLTVEGTATLTKPLIIAGGTFKTNGLTIGAGGTLDFDRGVLELTGGTITGMPSLNIPTNGELRVGGTHTLRIAGAAGSTLTATGNLAIGNASLANGFYSNGTVIVGANSVTLNDSNDAVLDSAALAAVGSGGAPGSLAAANGLTLNFGGNITGHGTINTPNNAAKPFINNGHVTGNSPGQPLTLPGYVKGVGIFDNVQFTGTFSPGFSPGKVNLGSAAYDGTLQVEIGGQTPGSGHDQLNHILGSGAAQLGGALTVSLLPGFAPSAGNVFEIITATGGITGTFNCASFPPLGGNLGWRINYGSNSVTLSVAAGLPGDYNADGLVDAADYTVWRNNLGSPTALPNDDTAGVGPDDYDRWKQFYGTSAGSGGLAAGPLQQVPEPSGLALAGIALAVAGSCRWRHG